MDIEDLRDEKTPQKLLLFPYNHHAGNQGNNSLITDNEGITCYD